MLGSLLRVLTFAFVLASATACTTHERLPAVPSDQALSVAFLGIPDSRFHLTTEPERFREVWLAAERRLAVSRGRQLGTEHMLALSGGGDNGAFGAGILYGWTQRGDRPDFALVTGVSTGALIAPFAFVGRDYDEQLKAVYTSVDQSDIAIQRQALAVLTSDSLADTAPLARLIAQYVTAEMIEKIGNEYRRGRLLLIGTTDLDLGQPVVWNIGAIAASGHPAAGDAIRKILLASASIPAFFPPVPIEVEVGGQRRQELHVDGGATTQAFLYPANVPLRDLPRDVGARRRVAWIIRNGRTLERPVQVERGLVPLAQRSISTMIAANSMGDIYRMYLINRRDSVDFNLAHVTSRFTLQNDKPFDRTYMNALFEHGRSEILRNAPWAKKPPGFEP